MQSNDKDTATAETVAPVTELVPSATEDISITEPTLSVRSEEVTTSNLLTTATATVTVDATGEVTTTVRVHPLFIFGLNATYSTVGHIGMMDEAQDAALTAFTRWHDAQRDPEKAQDAAGLRRIQEIVDTYDASSLMSMEDARIEVGNADAFIYRTVANSVIEAHDYLSRAFVFTDGKARSKADNDQTFADYEAWTLLNATADGMVNGHEPHPRDVEDCPELYAASEAIRRYILANRAKFAADREEAQDETSSNQEGGAANV